MRPQLSIIEPWAKFLAKDACNNIVTMSQNEHQQRIKRASTECQQSINRASTECQWSFNRASTVFDFASLIIKGQWTAVDPQPTYRLPVLAKMRLTILCLHPTIGGPQSVISLPGGSVSYTTMSGILLFLDWVLRCQSFQYVLVYNFTIMHALSHRFDFLASSSRVNI